MATILQRILIFAIVIYNSSPSLCQRMDAIPLETSRQRFKELSQEYFHIFSSDESFSFKIILKGTEEVIVGWC
jgi:hypothetical protein